MKYMERVIASVKKSQLYIIYINFACFFQMFKVAIYVYI
jgi:hypothetical protein